MSIIASVYLPEGIVLAGDSRLTGRRTENVNGQDIVKEFTISDNSQKVMLLEKVTVGIAFCGNAIIDGMTVADFIRKFEIDDINENDTIQEVADKLLLKTTGKGSEFLVCGYELDEPFVFYLTDKVERQNVNSIGNVEYGAKWGGRTRAISRLLVANPQTSVNWGLMPLKDGVDMAEFLIDLTIKYERFQDNIQTCGGPIDILVINKDKAFWHKHKLYRPE